MSPAPRVRVLLPRSLQTYWAGVAAALDVEGATLAAALEALSARHPGVGERIVDEQGRIRRHVLVFVNDASVAHLAPASVALKDGDTVRVLPAVSGGC